MKNYCLLTIKRINHRIPQFLLGILIIGTLLGGLVLLITQLLYRDQSAISIQVAVVSEEENELTNMALDYLKNMETLKDSIKLLELDEKEAFERLEKQTVDVVVYLPGGLLQGILDGTNVPVQIYMPKSTGLQSVLLKEMTDAGAQMLTVAQAEIYGNYDVVQAYDMQENLHQMEQEIDLFNLTFALNRLRLFEEQNLSATEQLDTLHFYGLAGGILFLFLFGICVSDFFLGETSTFLVQVKRNGVGVIAQHIIKTVVLWCYMSILLLVLLLSVRNGFPNIGMYVFSCITIAGMLVGFFVFIYSLVKKESIGVFAIFFVTILMLLCSGMLVPAVFMPSKLLQIGSYMPTTFLRQIFSGLLLENVSEMLMKTNLLHSLISAVIFHLAALGIIVTKGTKEV